MKTRGPWQELGTRVFFPSPVGESVCNGVGVVVAERRRHATGSGVADAESAREHDGPIPKGVGMGAIADVSGSVTHGRETEIDLRWLETFERQLVIQPVTRKRRHIEVCLSFLGALGVPIRAGVVRAERCVFG